MKLSSEGEAATNEPNNAFRSGFVELEEPLHVLLEVPSEYRDIWGGEHKSCQAREEDGDAVESLNTDACCRVATMTPCKARG